MSEIAAHRSNCNLTDHSAVTFDVYVVRDPTTSANEKIINLIILEQECNEPLRTSKMLNIRRRYKSFEVQQNFEPFLNTFMYNPLFLRSNLARPGQGLFDMID